MTVPIVLASTSPYRRQLLERLRIAFAVRAPQVDEALLPGESPAATADRLSLAKAMAVSQTRPDAIVIGSDQVADLDGTVINKPQTHDDAVRQLMAMQGRRVAFHTAVAVVRGAGPDCRVRTERVVTTVSFRRLRLDQVERYLQLDRPYDCAGSARIESLGICLIESVASQDPTALIGLPLIALTTMLAEFGVELPAG